MNGKNWLIGFVLTLFALLVVASRPVAARASRLECTGAEVRTAVLDPGAWTFPGGNIHVRGMVSQYQEESDCPQLAGVNVAAMNANWNANFVGPMWGTGRLETAYGGGGTWQGRWNGALSADGQCSYQAVMHGVSGSVTGMKVFLNADCTAVPSPWTATLLDPSAD
jgi:hypothetical protein